MDTRIPRRLTVTGVLPAILLLILPLIALAGCGENPSGEENLTQVAETATAFLNACGNLEGEEAGSLMSRDYVDENQVPDPLTGDDLVAVLGYVKSYRMAPAEDISVEGDRAVIAVTMEISGKGETEESLILKVEDGEWKVNAFTAMEWSSRQAPGGAELTEVEQALQDFLIACIDGDTQYIFEHLSQDYLDKHHLEEPWTAADFSGVFGTARSYDFDPNEIELEDDSAEVDVTVEFGSRGNLESETSCVFLVRKQGEWRIDAFPFFIY